jgi:hypothetical protein
MAKIKLKVKAKTLTAKQKADAAKKAKAMAKKKLSKVIAKDRAIKKSVAAKKAKGEGRAVNKDIQKKQQESKMATPVGKGRISESVKEVSRKDKQTPEIGTRGAAPRALLRRRPKSADEKRRDAILSDKGEGASSAQKAAMKETRKIEAPRRALNTLRSKVEKLRRKASKTDAEKAQLKKLVARLNKMESRREAMIQAGRSGSAKVSLAGPSGKIAVDTRKIKRRMAKGGKR